MYVYGRLVGIYIFLSIFVIKSHHPKVNQNIRTELKLTSPLLIPPYNFHVLGRANYSDPPGQELGVSLSDDVKIRPKMQGKGG